MASHTKSHHLFSPLPPKKVQEVREPGLFQSGYSQSNHNKQYFYITTSKVFYSLIEPQLHRYAPTCGYKFHALSVHLQVTFTTPPNGGTFGIQVNVCGRAFFANIVKLLRPLAIFAEELHLGCLTGF